MESLGSYLKRCFQVRATSGKVGRGPERGPSKCDPVQIPDQVDGLSAQAGKAEAGGDGGQRQLCPGDPGL